MRSFLKFSLYHITSRERIAWNLCICWNFGLDSEEGLIGVSKLAKL